MLLVKSPNGTAQLSLYWGLGQSGPLTQNTNQASARTEHQNDSDVRTGLQSLCCGPETLSNFREGATFVPASQRSIVSISSSRH